MTSIFSLKTAAITTMFVQLGGGWEWWWKRELLELTNPCKLHTESWDCQDCREARIYNICKKNPAAAATAASWLWLRKLHQNAWQQQRSLGSNAKLLVVRTDCCNVQRARRGRRGLLTLQLCLEWNLQWQLGTQSGRRNPQIWQSPAWCSCGRCAQCRCLQWYQHFECHSGQRGRALWHHGMVSVHTWTLQVDSTSAHAAWCDSCCLLQSSLSWLHREASHYPLRASRQCHPLPTKQKQLDKDSIKHIIIIIIIKCCRKQHFFFFLLPPPDANKQSECRRRKKTTHYIFKPAPFFFPPPQQNKIKQLEKTHSSKSSWLSSAAKNNTSLLLLLLLLPTTTTKQTIGENSIKNIIIIIKCCKKPHFFSSSSSSSSSSSHHHNKTNNWRKLHQEHHHHHHQMLQKHFFFLLPSSACCKQTKRFQKGKKTPHPLHFSNQHLSSSHHHHHSHFSNHQPSPSLRPGIDWVVHPQIT